MSPNYSKLKAIVGDLSLALHDWRISDVEKQPFRSMGFASVIITSVVFALGLPWECE